MLSFLTYHFEAGKAYQTLSGYRAALSSFLPPIDGISISQLPAVQQFFKGVYNMRPPQPRYTATWSVDKVLDFIRKSWPDNGQISFTHLSHKLLMLLMLAQPTRVAEVTYIVVPSIKCGPESASYCYSRPLKNQHSGALKSLVLKARDDPSICVVRCLETYLEVTEGFRVSPEQQAKLMLSVRRPFKPVTPSTLSRWVVQVLTLAGVDTSVYKTHSTRSAVTAAARAQGSSLKQILASAFWRSKSTYRRYYRKPVGSFYLFI
jgi:hypothetical protein